MICQTSIFTILHRHFTEVGEGKRMQQEEGLGVRKQSDHSLEGEVEMRRDWMEGEEDKLAEERQRQPLEQEEDRLRRDMEIPLFGVDRQQHQRPGDKPPEQ